MSLKYLRRNLSFIASQAVDTTLLTTDGKQINTRRLLLSSVSPYLAALISQVGNTDMVVISVPFSSEIIRDVLDNLASEDEECDDIEHEAFNTAREMGIMFLREKLKNNVRKQLKNIVKKEMDKDDSVSLEETFDITDIKDKYVSYDELKTDSAFKEESSKQTLIQAGKRKKKRNRKQSDKDESKEQKCKICNLEFKNISHLSMHNKKVHPGLKNFLCEECGKGFTTAGIRDTHIKNIHSDKNTSHLSMHNKKVHPGLKNFLCEECGKGFTTAGIRDTHIKNIHSDKNPFLCDHCGKGFSTTGNRNYHIDNVHSSGPGMKCPHCEKTVRYLSAHIKGVHPVEPVTCEECGKTFKTKRSLTDHMTSHLPDELRRLVREKEKEKHKCNTCGQGFIDSTRLKWHEASQHTGIKSFHCDHCTKSYFRSDHLKTHVASNHPQTTSPTFSISSKDQTCQK